MLHAPPAEVTKFVVQRVNGTREAVLPGGRAPLCNAIFPTAIDVRIRSREPRVTLVARYPHGVVRRHRARVRAGRAHVKLWAADERLPSGQFTAGRYRFTVRRTAATLTFTDDANC